MKPNQDSVLKAHGSDPQPPAKRSIENDSDDEGGCVFGDASSCMDLGFKRLKRVNAKDA